MLRFYPDTQASDAIGMSRSARLHFPGGVFHIISRCLNREFLLDGDAERARYLLMLEMASRRTHNGDGDDILTFSALDMIVRQAKPGRGG